MNIQTNVIKLLTYNKIIYNAQRTFNNSIDFTLKGVRDRVEIDF